MGRRIAIILMLGLLATGCGAADVKEATVGYEVSQTEESVEMQEISQTEEMQFSFEELEDLYFSFSSGAGAWRTELEIEADGSFTGVHSDSDMGDIGEGYPNGTFYLCEFEGAFTNPEKVNEYTYSMQIDHIEYEHEPETQEILDGVRHWYSTAYGLDGAEEILIYLPGAPFKELPEAYQNWVRNVMVDPDTEELPFYGLYNVKEQNGFSSHGKVSGIHALVTAAAEQANEIQTSLRNDPLTQMDMNEKSAELYRIWDDLLNALWTELKEDLTEDEFQKLLEEQRTWIKEKEQEVKEAGEAFAGGSMRPLVENSKAAELTELRVYELYEQWKQTE